MKTLNQIGVSPYPWVAKCDSKGRWDVMTRCEQFVTRLIDPRDCRLMSASPNLYTACSNALNFLQSGTLSINTEYEKDCVDGVCKLLEEAIEKAGGRNDGSLETNGEDS